MQIEVSVGEIVDKLSILEIKKQNITDKTKRANVVKEYDYLYGVVFDQLNIELVDYNGLVAVNKALWDIEDDIRVKEHKKKFDEDFVSLARKVYITNDKRAEIKKDINIKYNSLFVEEKSYEQY
jgi:hypothetical protein